MATGTQVDDLDPSSFEGRWPHTVTGTQPFTYRDTMTLLRKVQDIAVNLDTIQETLQNLIDAHNQLDSDTGARFDAVDANLTNLSALLGDLQKAVGDYVASTLVYNPTKGDYEDSRNSLRDIYRELAVFGARTSQMAGLTAAEAAAHSNLEMAVVGNLTVFGNDVPRVTPVEGEA